MNKYLLEIGTEELPYEFIPSAIEQLKTELSKALEENKIEFSGIKKYSTPRRLAVIIENLPVKQEDIKKTVKGPMVNVALDAQGNYTQAAIGFANKNNVEIKDLFQEDNYIWAKIEQKGKYTKDILEKIVPQSVLKLRGAHFMRWANLDVKFQRPIRWIVSLFNNDEVPIQIADVKSSNISRGHRFKSDSVKIKSPEAYEEALLQANVIADNESREEKVIKSSKIEASKLGAEAILDAKLVEEVTNLVEWPIPVVCNFEEKYLDIPEKVTVTVMATHQRYFPLYKDDKLLNKFITVSNYLGNDFENIKAGNERVVRARLEDAIFFFKEDTKKSLVDSLESIKGVTFQKGFGSLYEKTHRIIELSKYLCKELNVAEPQCKSVERTALLCKADITSKLVFEFTELQGYIGGHYASLSGESKEVARGIEEHYYPLNSESDVSTHIEGQIVGIADKIDNITAAFADGKKVTGSQDPLGIRRATLGILKTVILNNLNIDINNLIKKSIDLLPVNIENKEELYNNVKDFVEQRLIVLYTNTYKHDVIKACVSNKNVLSNLKDFVERLSIVAALIEKPDYTRFHEAINRIIRIIKGANNHQIPKKALFVNEAENNLWTTIENIDTEKLSYPELEALLLKSTDAINDFFDKVLVMDENEEIKQNRINLLSITKQKFDKIADFSEIVF